jgi:hypothetical protein
LVRKVSRAGILQNSRIEKDLEAICPAKVRDSGGFGVPLSCQSSFCERIFMPMDSAKEKYKNLSLNSNKNSMRNIAVLIFIIIPSVLFGQERFENHLTDRLCGLRIEGKSYYNLGEYSIFTDKVDQSFTPPNIAKLRKTYKLKKGVEETSTNAITEKNKVLTQKIQTKGNHSEIETYYFINRGNTQIDIVGFMSVNFRDSIEEQHFLKLYLEKRIPESVFMEYPVSKVDFAGRKMELNSSCNWRNVNSIQCPYSGQMNWSLHPSLENAKKRTENQYEITKQKGIAQVIVEDNVPIVFEGKDIIVKRTRYKMKVPKFLMGGSNELIVYYVSEEVRGRFISCVLSHYSNDALTENGVPPLLDKVMKVKK